MYGPYVRDKFPARNHLPTILDIEAGHAERHGHPMLWFAAALIAIAGAASWYLGVLPLPH
jgi:hypothetical protein